jgi:mRNA-degrading endonuclease RelE of RelBE toxin-antitoxin system
MTRKKALSVEWDINEFQRFKELIKEIKKRSENLSQKIRQKVKDNLTVIKKQPYIFEADPLKVDNDGSFRKFTAVQIRVVYKIESDKIIIVRIRHALSEPTDY